MAVNNNVKASLVRSHFTTSSLLMITSVVMFVGAFAIKYQCSNLFKNYFEDYLEMPVSIVIAGSVIIFADACLGLISLAHGWYHGVITFLVCTACLLVAMIALVALTYGHLNIEEKAMYSRLEEDLKNHEISMDAINAVQLSLKCCGYNNFNDWANETGKNIPQSCCMESHPCDTNSSWDINLTGCYRAMRLFFDCRKWIVAAVLVITGLIQIVAITLSVVIYKSSPREITLKVHTATDNDTEANVASPRIHNPLGQNSVPSVDNKRRNEIYVRRPAQLSLTALNYRNPHENFLRQPPRIRYDRRILLPRSKLIQACATRPG